MTDAYNGRDSRRSNSPCGHFRSELIRVTKANELVLSGSPIEYFTHADYRLGSGKVTVANHKFGVAKIYNHTDLADLSPLTYVESVSEDGLTITLSGGNCDVGDLVEVYYYSAHAGTADHLTASQIGDALPQETLNAVCAKINDTPPLDFEQASMKFDMKLCYSTTVPAGGGATTTVAKWAATQVGTWQTTHTPFYVTAVWLAWGTGNPTDQLGCDLVLGHESDVSVLIKVDSGTERTYNLADAQRVINPEGYYQGTMICLGLVECESDFQVRVYDDSASWGPSVFTTQVSGWHL